MNGYLVSVDLHKGANSADKFAMTCAPAWILHYDHVCQIGPRELATMRYKLGIFVVLAFIAAVPLLSLIISSLLCPLPTFAFSWPLRF